MPIPLGLPAITGWGLAKGALGVLGGIFGNKSKKKQQKFDNNLALRQVNLQEQAQRDRTALDREEFDWRKQGDSWKMGQEGLELANKRANQNARNPMARQIMAALHKMGGYDQLAQMDAYRQGNAVLGPTAGVQAPVPGQPQAQPQPPMNEQAMRALYGNRSRPRLS